MSVVWNHKRCVFGSRMDLCCLRRGSEFESARDTNHCLVLCLVALLLANASFLALFCKLCLCPIFTTIWSSFIQHLVCISPVRGFGS